MSDAAQHPPEVTPLGGGRYLVRADGVQQLAYAVAGGGRVWVCVDGRGHEIDTRPATRRREGHDQEAALAAPMPATVLGVEVSPGQRVTRGDVLIRLEAMKMELPVRAPRDGIVTAVACRPGELVQPGVPLVELA